MPRVTNHSAAVFRQNLPAGSLVLHARAVDPDDPLTPSGHLSYSFLGGATVSKDGLFSIGEKRRLDMVSLWGELACP